MCIIGISGIIGICDINLLASDMDDSADFAIDKALFSCDKDVSWTTILTFEALSAYN